MSSKHTDIYGILSKLIQMSQQDCTCEKNNTLGCPSCISNQELDHMYDFLVETLGRIETDYK